MAQESPRVCTEETAVPTAPPAASTPAAASGPADRATTGPAAWFRVALGMFLVAVGANLFAPLLPVMREVHDLSQAQVNFTLAIYVLGLVPALMVGGPMSDRKGRRAAVRPALLFSMAGTTVTLLAHLGTGGAAGPVLLVIGRLITGIAVGLVLAAGASWLKEVTPASAGVGVAARRATVATSAGFGMGPLVAGPVAEWIPGPDVTTLVVHLVLVLVCTPLIWTTPAPPSPAHAVAAGTPRRPALIPATARQPRFLASVASWAPWAFGCATTSFAALAPVAAQAVGPNVAYTGVIAGITMLTGALVQPWVGRHADSGRGPHPAVLGLGAATVGMLLAVLLCSLAPGTAAAWVMVPAAVVLGTAYGIMMVSGLREVQRIAPPEQLGALTAVFYALTYVGFFVPFVIALLEPHTGYVPIFVFGAVVTVASIPLVIAATRGTRGPQVRQDG
jgi:MFS family permease